MVLSNSIFSSRNYIYKGCFPHFSVHCLSLALPFHTKPPYTLSIPYVGKRSSLHLVFMRSAACHPFRSKQTTKQYWLESSVPRVPHKVQRALQRERAEREQKGGIVFAGSSGVGGDYAKFEANFNRALSKGDTAEAVTVKGGGGGAAAGAAASSSPYSSTRTNNLGGGGGLESRVVMVSDNLTATTPTASGRARKGYSVNLGAFSSASTVASLTPRGGPAAVYDDRGRGGAATTPPSRSASLPRSLGGGDMNGGGRKGSPSLSSAVPLPPPSAATRYGGSEVALSSPPPPPAKRFDWGADG